MGDKVRGTITSFSYQQGTPGYLKQGVKGNRRPRGAVRGDNGSFIMAGDRPKVTVNVRTEDGKEQSVDMYRVIKDNSSRKMSETYVNALMSGAIGATFEASSVTRGILETIAPCLK